MSTTNLIRALDQQNLELVRSLIALKVKPNQPSVCGTYPIVVAILSGFNEGLRELIKAGADPNIKTVEEYTPLGLAVQSGNYDAADLLLRNGANPNEMCRDLTLHAGTPIHHATKARDQKMVDLLLRYGAISVDVDVDCMPITTQTATNLLHRAVIQSCECPELAPFLTSGIDMNSPCGNDMPIPLATPLILAAHFDRYEWLSVLLAAGADLTRKDALGKDALMHAVEQGNLAVCRLLITFGACASSSYSLILAAQLGDALMVEKLLQEGIDVNVSDQGTEHPYRGSPICWAAAYGHTHIVSLLLPRSTPEEIAKAQRLALECGHKLVTELLSPENIHQDNKPTDIRPLSFENFWI